MLGLAHKAGRVEIGEEPVGSAARARKARIILVASDAAAGSVSFASTGNCLCLVIPATKDELGRALGRTSCAIAAVTDIGFADAVAKKLAALEPEKYESAAERMAVKAQRARERRQEQLNHEKNLRTGKKKATKPAPPEEKSRSEKEKAPPQGRSTPERKKSGRPDGRTRGAAARQRQKAQARVRFEGSRPVKKGKGSGRKDP
mgnify:CR=1 FL=1